MRSYPGRQLKSSTGLIFPSVSAAARHYGVTPQTIGKALKYGYKVVGESLSDVGEWTYQTKETANSVRVKTSDGRVFPSVKAAAEALNVHPNNVTRVLTGKRKKVSGLSFEYD